MICPRFWGRGLRGSDCLSKVGCLRLCGLLWNFRNIQGFLCDRAS